jgi:hypothetical protein
MDGAAQPVEFSLRPLFPSHDHARVEGSKENIERQFPVEARAQFVAGNGAIQQSMSELSPRLRDAVQHRRQFVRSQAFGNQIGDDPADQRMSQDRARGSKVFFDVRLQRPLVGGTQPHDLDALYRFARELQFRRPPPVYCRLACARSSCHALQAYCRIAGLCPLLEQCPKQRDGQFGPDDRRTTWFPSLLVVGTLAFHPKTPHYGRNDSVSTTG